MIVDVQKRIAAVMGERQKVMDNCLHLITRSGLPQTPLIITEQYPKGVDPKE